MSERVWIAAIQGVVVAFLLSVVMGWVARSRHRAQPRTNSRRLVHPPSTLIIGLVGFIFFGGIAVASNVFRNKTTTWWTTAGFIGFALLSVPMVADYFLGRHEMTEDGLNHGSLTGRRGYLRWADLRRASYSQTMKWFRLETQSGSVVRISAMLIGLPEFARLLLTHAPAEAIAPEALPVLEATAAGHPPPVWS